MKIKRKSLNIVFTGLITLVMINLVARNRYSHNSQFAILIFVIFIYLVWAYCYHKLDKSLTYANYLEYVLTATLAIILLLGVLNI